MFFPLDYDFIEQLPLTRILIALTMTKLFILTISSSSLNLFCSPSLPGFQLFAYKIY